MKHLITRHHLSIIYRTYRLPLCLQSAPKLITIQKHHCQFLQTSWNTRGLHPVLEVVSESLEVSPSSNAELDHNASFFPNTPVDNPPENLPEDSKTFTNNTKKAENVETNNKDFKQNCIDDGRSMSPPLVNGGEAQTQVVERVLDFQSLVNAVSDEKKLDLLRPEIINPSNTLSNTW